MFNYSLTTENEKLLTPTILDKRFPNSIASDNFGKVYIGDSLGTIHIFEVVYDDGIKVSKIKSVSHKKLEGDEINKITIDPLEKERILVHSRDNSIRLINPTGKNGKMSIEIEYKGLKCNKTNLKSVISPDGQYIISGNEEGTPMLWHLLTGFEIERNKSLHCKFIDFVSDVSWNEHFNLIALSGFSQEYPILLYVYEKSDEEVEQGMLKMNINAMNYLGDHPTQRTQSDHQNKEKDNIYVEENEEPPKTN